MQIVSNGVKFAENVKICFFWENKKNVTNMSSAELAPRVVKVNYLTVLPLIGV